jgi:hypothetical protein
MLARADNAGTGIEAEAEGPPCGNDHDDDLRKATRMGASVARRAGVGAVGAGHARDRRRALVLDHLLRQAGRADLVQVNASAVPWLLALVSAPTVGAVLATRRPRHPVGWLLLGLGGSIGLLGFGDSYVVYGQLARPGALPAARWLAIYSPAVTLAGISCVGFVLLLTPTGSLPSTRWRWWARVAAAAPVVYLVAITLKS